MDKLDKSEKAAIKKLKAKGYQVIPKYKYVKHTFEVPVPLLKQFLEIVEKENMRIKHAIAEAFQDWIDKR